MEHASQLRRGQAGGWRIAVLTRFGLLMPHFGASASRSRLVEGARLAESYGFDSLWVRDHLIFEPHGMEGTSTLFVEPLITLAYLSGVTEHIGLGTATLIPTRHPIQLAQGVTSLSWLSGRALDLGFGSGRFQHEFDAIGLGSADRPKLAGQQLEAARRLWAGLPTLLHSTEYNFENVSLSPTPVSPVRIWWGGAAPASARIAAERYDGWLPARLDLATFQVRAEAVRKQCESAGRPLIGLGNIPITTLGTSRADALSRINLAGLLDHANALRFAVKPPSGRFETADDLLGGLLAGTANDVVQDLERLVAAGCNLVIFDLRFRFEDWLDQIQILGEEVLPKLTIV
jgi:alkanesulfonate monooxygenase SsuD/methylene tetrahydromethanopterin reductase-like flavin-dependent oxidoreductase (luciferase family)